MLSRKNLMGLNLQYYTGGHLPSPTDVLDWFTVFEAGWMHDARPQSPHALLASGKHSNGFFLCKRVLKFGNLREILAACIIDNLRQSTGMGEMWTPGGVYGAPYSSITLAADVGRLLGVPNYIVEKGPKDANGKDTMIFKDDDPIPEGTTLLEIEELITVATSVTAATNAIVNGNPYPVEFAPYVGALIHRPPELVRRLSDGREIAAFIERQVDAWSPSDCPLCQFGSKVLPPKTNWAELTGRA
jgi:orotate phosphoribosyltransferase